MLENFNGIFYLVIFLIILAMNAFYAYNCLFNTKNFISKYGVDVTAAFFARFAGAVILGAVLMQLYILFRGTAATGAFFNFMFIIMSIIAISAYYTGEVDKLGRTDQYSREGWLSTGGLAIGWGILCLGLSDKIYI